MHNSNHSKGSVHNQEGKFSRHLSLLFFKDFDLIIDFTSSSFTTYRK